MGIQVEFISKLNPIMGWWIIPTNFNGFIARNINGNAIKSIYINWSQATVIEYFVEAGIKLQRIFGGCSQMTSNILNAVWNSPRKIWKF